MLGASAGVPSENSLSAATSGPSAPGPAASVHPGRPSTAHSKAAPARGAAGAPAAPRTRSLSPPPAQARGGGGGAAAAAAAGYGVPGGERTTQTGLSFSAIRSIVQQSQSRLEASAAAQAAAAGAPSLAPATFGGAVSFSSSAAASHQDVVGLHRPLAAGGSDAARLWGHQQQPHRPHGRTNFLLASGGLSSSRAACPAKLPAREPREREKAPGG